MIPGMTPHEERLTEHLALKRFLEVRQTERSEEARRLIGRTVLLDNHRRAIGFDDERDDDGEES